MISPDGEPPNLADFGGVLVSEPYSRFNSMDLFDRSRERLLAEQAPLAARMRPRSLEEFVGQEQIRFQLASHTPGTGSPHPRAGAPAAAALIA